MTEDDSSSDALGIRVRRGRIGIVGPRAAAQEIAARVHDFASGISQHIDTGTDDLGPAGDGAQAIQGMLELDADPDTDVVVFVTTAPSPVAAEHVLDALAAARTPIVACLIGAGEETIAAAADRAVDLHRWSKPAALAAVVASGVDPETLDLHALNVPLIEQVRGILSPAQSDIRGLFSNPALCAEALALAIERHPAAASNLPARGAGRADAASPPRGHVFLYLDDADPQIPAAERARLLLASAEDPAVGVVVVDFVLGTRPDPVGELAPAIVAAKARALAQGRHLEVLGYVLGTDEDSPTLTAQADALVATGATWASSATNAGLLAREFVAKG